MLYNNMINLKQIWKIWQRRRGMKILLMPVFVNTIRDWSGSLKSIYYQPYTSGMFYNKDLFEQAGIIEVPQTWAEFTDACKKMVDAGIEPMALDSEYALYMFGYHLARYVGQDAVKDLALNGNWSANEDARKLLRI